jgi:hypothetical protein
MTECAADAQCLSQELRAYIGRSVAAHGGSRVAVNPGNRVAFSWPPHPESYGFHLNASDWKLAGSIDIGGEEFVLELADTRAGLFGRLPELWFEARAINYDQLIPKLKEGVQPLLERQRLVAGVLECSERFTGHIPDLPPLDLLKLLYAPDRDIVNDARREIETHASSGLFFPSLIAVLEDNTHPYRRSAQWAVLDLFEDMASFARTEEDWELAVEKIKDLIWNAEDDYARVIYKAGVVLGGHMPYLHGARAVAACLEAPSRIGRRSAIHAMYHVAEWAPEHTSNIISRVLAVAANDPEPLLRAYAAAMAADIERGDMVHAEDIWFPGEV